MDALLAVANWLLPLVYLALLIDYGAAFFLRARDQGRNPWLGPAIVFAASVLLLQALRLGRPYPATNYEVMAVVALATAGVYMLIEYLSRDRRTGVFVFLVVFLFQYTASIFAPEQAAPAGLAQQPVWGRVHMLPAIVAYTSFTIAAIYGLLHLVAQRDLKQHRVGLLFDRLPPLERLGSMCWHAVAVGFGFITLAMISGALMYQRTSGEMDFKVLSKIVTGAAAWLIYGLAVVCRLAGRCPPGRVSRIAVYGFAVVLLMLVASIVLSFGGKR